MRLFLAIELPTPVRDALAALSRRLQKHPELDRCSWTRRENLHITLKFFGEVAETEVCRICDAMGSLGMDGLIGLMASGMELLPPRGPVRVIAAGMEGDLARLDKLHRQVEEAAQKIGFPPEGRRFRPHVTVARARQPLLPLVRKKLDVLAAELLPSPQMTVGEIVLMESRLNPDAAQYIPLARFPIEQVGDS